VRLSPIFRPCRECLQKRLVLYRKSRSLQLFLRNPRFFFIGIRIERQEFTRCSKDASNRMLLRYCGCSDLLVKLAFLPLPIHDGNRKVFRRAKMASAESSYWCVNSNFQLVKTKGLVAVHVLVLAPTAISKKGRYCTEHFPIYSISYSIIIYTNRV
jgi:hypothetical protein